MSFKKFSAAQETPGKDGSADKVKEALPANEPTTPPDQKPADVAPAPKS